MRFPSVSSVDFATQSAGFAFPRLPIANVDDPPCERGRLRWAERPPPDWEPKWMELTSMVLSDLEGRQDVDAVARVHAPFDEGGDSQSRLTGRSGLMPLRRLEAQSVRRQRRWSEGVNRVLASPLRARTLPIIVAEAAFPPSRFGGVARRRAGPVTIPITIMAGLELRTGGQNTRPKSALIRAVSDQPVSYPQALK